MTTAPVVGKNIMMRALIGPHAGYRFCGQTSAFAYHEIYRAKKKRKEHDQDSININGYHHVTNGENGANVHDRVKTIFVIGPSHHVYMNNQCALTRAHSIQTPIGSLRVNRSLVDELFEKYGRTTSGGSSTSSQQKQQLFTLLGDMSEEEEEHSLEMHFPFIAKSFDPENIDLVPIIVGQLNSETAQRLGAILSTYIDDPSFFFVISSDFCHWGKRFNYTYYDEDKGEIWQSIQALDLLGSAYICNKDIEGFEQYLSRYKNTICGRHAILVLLNAMNQSSGSSDRFDVQLCDYSQSSRVTHASDSSVSYASFAIYQK